MQVGSPAGVAGTVHPRRRLNAILAIAAIVGIAAVVALLVWVVPLATSGVRAEDAIPKVEPSWVTLYDGEGSAHQVHVRTGGVEDAAPWVVLYDDEGNAHLVNAR
jgi:hypothetical protein